MGLLKRQQRWWRRTRAGLACLIALLLNSPLARAEPVDSAPVQLQLDVRINGFPLNLIAGFAQLPDGKVASPRSELTELGVVVPGEGADDELIVLDTLSGVSYVYDESNQSIELELPNSARLARDLDGGNGEFLPAESGNGVVLNYTAYAAGGYDIPDSRALTDGGSLSLDGRAFSKFGTLRQTGILGTTTFSDFTALRLDTTWSYSDQKAMRSYHLGDIISGGLNWTRPIRLGGAQVRRNFDLRPDLLTMPLPLIEGSAEVPSSLKVFIGGVQAYSNDEVPPGPFRIDSLPVYTNSGTARVVLTDATGREIETEQDFYTSPDLLKQHLYDFSIEAGVVRRDFASHSFDYDDSPVGLASLRYGIQDFVTGEAHVEASSSLIDVGVGALVSGGPLGLFSAAVAGSLHEGDTGIFLHAGWEGKFGNFSASIATSRTFGDFADLAAVTERHSDGDDFAAGVPKALEQVSLNYSFDKFRSGVGLSFIHQLDSEGDRSLILSGSYTQTFFKNLTAFISGFADFGDEEEYGAFVGFSMPFGENISTSAGATVTENGWTAVAEASKPSDGAPGSHGWRVAHGEGDLRYTAANGSYRGTKAAVAGHIVQQDDAVNGNVAVDGAAVFAGGGVFLSPPISDSFAVVDVGAPDVTVEYENRFAGKTGKNGKLLLTELRAFQKNKIAVDVTNLPLNADVPESEAFVVPRDMSGVVLDFGVKTDPAAALVTLTDAEGNYLPEGSEVTLEGSAEPTVMGYDGQVYLTGLAASNTVTVKVIGNKCQASFNYEPDPENQTMIGPLKCL